MNLFTLLFYLQFLMIFSLSKTNKFKNIFTDIIFGLDFPCVTILEDNNYEKSQQMNYGEWMKKLDVSMRVHDSGGRGRIFKYRILDVGCAFFVISDFIFDFKGQLWGAQFFILCSLILTPMFVIIQKL